MKKKKEPHNYLQDEVEFEELIHDMDVADNVLGSSTGMSFTFDDDGYAKIQKSFTTTGSDVKVTGTINKPDGVFNIEVKTSAGTDKKVNDVATNEEVDLKLKTNFGSTTVTFKVWSQAGSDDAGVDGHIKIEY
tara:strand:+ start:363 stop:761 length:399 start_codon:yes stop_codon:yes gene_type:complete